VGLKQRDDGIVHRQVSALRARQHFRGLGIDTHLLELFRDGVSTRASLGCGNTSNSFPCISFAESLVRGLPSVCPADLHPLSWTLMCKKEALQGP
jgi:hypothetical protein